MIIDLTEQEAAFCQGRQVRAMLKGGAVAWPKEIPPLAPYYGVGPGKIAIHLNPANAVMSGANVTSIPNSGGAGSVFAAIAAAGVTRSGDWLVLAGDNNFRLSNAADIQGVRLFVPAYRTATGQAYFMGAAGAVTTAVRYAHSGASDTTVQFSASNGGISPSPGSIPRGVGVWSLIEIEMTAAATRVWYNGTESAAGGGRATPYPVQQIGRHPDMTTGPIWTGSIGDIVGVTLGAGDAAAISAARAYLAAKYGITVA